MNVACAGPDLGGPGPQASHQKGASHQTLQFLFRPGLPPVKSDPAPGPEGEGFGVVTKVKRRHWLWKAWYVGVKEGSDQK